MQELELGRREHRGKLAENLLNDELLQEAFQVIHDDYLGQWLRTDTKDTEIRERLWAAIRILGQVELHLKKVVRDGRLATSDLAKVKYLKR